MKKSILLWFCSIVGTIIYAQSINIIPKPVEVTLSKQPGSFTITSATQLVVHGTRLENSVLFLKDYLKQFYDLDLRLWMDSSIVNAIHLNFERMDHSIPGAYSLQIKNDGIFISGDNEAGVFYGVQSLLQLLPPEKNKPLKIPFTSIKDYPRFEYRGLHLDVGRHFFPVEFLKKYIDYIALHKMNYFHWHLTEDQGWRIEIKKYPLLTSVGAYRNGTLIGRYPGKGNDNIRYGGFYTQEQVKEIIDYAARRYITVVPEIELPGHGSAAIAAYPWLSCFPNEKTKIPENMISEASKKATGKLVQETWGVFDDVFCAGNDSTFSFLQDVIDEVIALFPSKYVHVGGDECPKTHWKKCPRCQQRMKENNLKDEHELQSYFIQRMEKYINSKGKTLIGWDEILEGGLAPNAIVMSWRGEEGGIEAAKQNHMVIMTPGNYVYLDHSQTKNEDSVTIGGYTPVEETYSYEPVPKELPADKSKFVLGAQGNVWTEYMKNTSKVEYMIFPRVSALSEVLWSPKATRNFKDFEKRLKTQFKRYELWAANHSKAYFDLKASILPTPNNDGLYYSLESPDKGTNIVYQVTKSLNENQTAAANNAYKSPLKITSSNKVRAWNMIDGRIVSSIISQSFSFNKATGKKIKLTTTPSKQFPGNAGSFGLINGVLSDRGVSSSEWLGWQGADMEAVIDLGKMRDITNVNVHVLVANGSQVCRPRYMETFVSSDGKNFTSVAKTTEFRDEANSMANMSVEFGQRYTRFVKVVVKNYGVIPDGMNGAGNKAWLFVDEIQID